MYSLDTSDGNRQPASCTGNTKPPSHGPENNKVSRRRERRRTKAPHGRRNEQSSLQEKEPPTETFVPGEQRPTARSCATAAKESRRAKRPHILTYAQIIILGFLAIILLGTLLLMLPVASRADAWTPFSDALFTATSATCVTGLTVVDTYTHWSLFGQAVILLLIQIGGLGFMTLITMVSIFMRRRIGLHERRLLMQSAGTVRRDGVVRLIRMILRGTFLFELVGMVLLAIRFCPEMGLSEGMWNALFHAVSAFCNAGFDLMGKYAQFSSMTRYADDPLVTLTLSFLVIVGGIGFMVWHDLAEKKLDFRRYEMQTKIVIVTTAALVISGWALFFLSEYSHAMAGMSLPEKLLASFFQSVTPRTAGFSGMDYSRLSEGGIALTIVLMMIGGSSGSTAGGIKITTFAVLVLGAFRSASGRDEMVTFHRRIPARAFRQAGAILTVYLMAITIATFCICLVEPAVSLQDVLFEAVSALCTVGLSLGMTPALSTASHMILAFLMFAGRVGGMSLILALTEKRETIPVTRPEESILIG